VRQTINDAMQALDCLRSGVARATAGEESVVELCEPASPHLVVLVDTGVLVDVTPLLIRGGMRPRILLVPRRKTGLPTVTEVLGVDHARLDDLLDRIEAQAHAMDVGVASTVFQFAWSMRRHMWIEDHILFPTYERSARVPLAEHMRPFRVEHACIEHYTSLLLRASELLSRPETRADAMDDLLHVQRGLVGVLDEHDRREERSLFPTIDHTASFVKRPDVLRRVVSFDPDMTSVMASTSSDH
jgi:hemerythrin-like domain-containing protein